MIKRKIKIKMDNVAIILSIISLLLCSRMAQFALAVN